MEYQKFNPLNVSSKFAICGLPIRVDTYKTCSFGCIYCFANCRKIMEFEKELKIGNINTVKNKLHRIFDDGKIDESNFLDVLISNRYTWHCGGMSDPFQPIEGRLGITRDLIKETAKYGINILFSTKSDTVYDCDIIPELHSFQISVSNIDNRKDIEPNVPDISKRVSFYKQLKARGFKVGIRLQPFIPGISSPKIIDIFNDADNFTIEGLKLVPQNKEHKKAMISLTGLNETDFKQMGLLNLRPEIRATLYEPLIKKLNSYGISYSIADNDMHQIETNKCCCGDSLVRSSTSINNTAMISKYGIHYTKDQLDMELHESGISRCKCNHLFTSNRQEGCISVQDFYDKRFFRKSSPFSPQFLYTNLEETCGYDNNTM